jgi:2-dehydro-3-deoxygalactonokinase
MSGSSLTSDRRFLSCDWGTSALRLRLVDARSGCVLGSSRGEQGVAATFAAWKAAGASPAERWGHFARVIAQHLARIVADTGVLAADVPLVISGMASSSMGLRELPYGGLPLACDGTALTAERIAASDHLAHPVILISGVRSADDVMRGEETQLIGACALGAAGDAAWLRRRHLVFPGTHSKHVEVRDACAVGFRTFMTGEFFDLLSTKSVLANSVTPGAELGTPENLAGFQAGVRAGAASSVLNAAFHVRTRALLQHAAATENYHYLSGLLIGAEVSALAAADAPITLVGAGPLLAAYTHAFRALEVRAPLGTLDADACLIAGQQAVAARLGYL